MLKWPREYIAETGSGSLYHVSFWGRGFTCKQLLGKTKDLSKDDVRVVAFRKGGKGAFDPDNLKLEHFRPGVQIMMADNSRTSPIIKIFEKMKFQ